MARRSGRTRRIWISSMRSKKVARATLGDGRAARAFGRSLGGLLRQVASGDQRLTPTKREQDKTEYEEDHTQDHSQLGVGCRLRKLDRARRRRDRGNRVLQRGDLNPG